ncbi:MAG: Veg family protein [Bacilli bacterium]|nr:Veg family protein [Bacilli bacterium]
MISKIKDNLIELQGKPLHFRFNGARNQIEEFDGCIENTYNYIFTIKLDGDSRIKSFTYSDVLIENLEITELQNKDT